jgi:predicted ATPase/class 3 adenylate cyclase
VTFLFTDVEGSTRLWDGAPAAMRSALGRHDAILRSSIESRGGRVFATGGDGFATAFLRAGDAVAAALDSQVELAKEPWTEEASLAVRMGLHTGAAEHRGDDFFGPVLNRAARIMSAGHGGQVLLSAATESLVRDELPAGCALVDLGEHRLRDLGRPERIFQLVHPDLGRDFGRLRTLDAYPGNLPLQLSSLVGRDDDIERVGQALKDFPVVTLTGVGGVGKTRLALQVAAEVLPQFRDGAWLCELQMVRDPAGVVDAVAAVFRVSARPGQSLEESLVTYLQDQKLLIMLDNCEHLLRPVAGLVAAIEKGCPDVKVLATSREGLNLRGEQILGVPSLGVPDNDADLGGIAGSEAAQLFVDRARAVKADFSLDVTNTASVGEVCRRLDGVPLAIELAAARVTAMNPAELARRLDRRFRLLTGGERVAVERHQTLRATIDWSYDLLSEPQRRLLARLSVFAGGCTLDAAEAVCAGDPIEAEDVLDLLSDLVARSLVVADDQGPETRYRLLETIRQYGEERLGEVGETEDLRQRQARHYAEFASLVKSQIYGPEQLEWAARLARERDNLHLAFAYALDRQDVEAGFGLCQVPWLFMQVNELVDFDPAQLLAIPGAAQDPGYPVALVKSAILAWYRDADRQSALRLCAEAEAADKRLHGSLSEWTGYGAQSLRAMIAQASGATEEAVEHYLTIDRRLRTEAPALVAIGLGSLAMVVAWSNPNDALRYATDGLALARKSGVPYSIMHTLEGLALALIATDPDRALALLEEAFGLATALGYESPGALYVGVFVAARLGQWPAVLRAAERVLHHQLRTGNFSIVYMAAMVNLVARGLAETHPETAAVLQGAVGVLLADLPTDFASQVRGGGLDENDVAAFVTKVRHDTTGLLTDALGNDRLRALRAEGRSMSPNQAYAFARARINAALAEPDGSTQGRATQLHE